MRADNLRALADEKRPRTRAECLDGPRPCPWVGCRHHLYLDVNPATGSVKLNFPALAVDELEETCCLDVADHAPATLDDVGALLNLTRERARQIELIAMIRARAAAKDLDLDLAPEGTLP